ncbi:Hsp20/alpha crystallin family protein [Motiliproteus sp.]|uniref:Hsp20/alpha crystallin family protein n=1 Tax=Motiliproteus sp. TaxID=1898955 RepID=UPI003BAC7681
MTNLTRFNRLFGDTFFDDFFRPVDPSGSDKPPAIDVHDNEDGYLIKADLPGISKEDIEVKLDNGILTIKAETRSEDREEKDGKLIRQERHYGQYLRQLSVGSDVDPSAVKANFDNGVLTLSLPKQQRQLPEGVKIDIG